ncbi:MAG: hypothetical protein HXX09_03705 [Bacteroidetes bacterium]|nr:hypothetical protein [Bacteroidota bacterium]
MKKIFVLIVLFSVLYAKIGFSQNLIVFEQTKNESYLFKNSNTPTQSQIISNFFIQEIAKSIPKIISYTQYTYSYDQSLRIIKEQNGNYTATVELKNGICAGDINFKGYSVAECLIPSKIDFKVTVQNDAGLTIKTFVINQVPVKTQYAKIAEFKFNDTVQNPKYKLIVENKNFYYDNVAKEVFEKKISLIHDYYASDMQMGNGFEKIQSMNLDNIDLIPLYSIKIKEVQQLIEMLNSKHFAQNLNLIAFDPIKFQDKFMDLNQKTNNLAAVINQLMATLDQVYYKRGLEYLVNGDVDKSIYYFNKSIEVNPFFAPSHLQLAKIEFSEGNLDKSGKILKTILVQMNPDPTTYNLVIQLCNSIYFSYIGNGEKMIGLEKFNEALTEYAKAKDFCNTTPGIVCNDALGKGIARAKYGIYNSFLTVAKRSFESSELELAEHYTMEAKNFQKANNNDIFSCSEADALLSQLADAYTTKGLNLNNQNNFEKALTNFTKAFGLCQSSTNLVCSEKLKNGNKVAKIGYFKTMLASAKESLQQNNLLKAEELINKAKAYQTANSEDITSVLDANDILAQIKYQYYLQFIHEGSQFVAYQQFETALGKLELARDLENNYTFKKAKNLDSLFQVAAKPIIIENIKKGNIKVWGKDIEGAKTILNNAISQQSKYVLTEDKDISKAITELKGKIFSQECFMAQEDYDKFYAKAQQAVNIKKFIEAETNYDAAIKVASDFVSCSISAQNSTDNKFKYITAITYQKLLLETEKVLKNENYSQTLEKFNAADKYYYQNEIKKFEIGNIQLFDFIKGQNNQNFISYCVNYYTENKNYNEALSLLKILKDRNYPQNYSKGYQEKLGQEMAIKDKSENALADPKENLTRYISGDKWFKYFNKAYTKAWKSKK